MVVATALAARGDLDAGIADVRTLSGENHSWNIECTRQQLREALRQAAQSPRDLTPWSSRGKLLMQPPNPQPFGEGRDSNKSEWAFVAAY